MAWRINKRDRDQTAARLMARVKPDKNGCWLWKGGIRDNGYGIFAIKRNGRWTQTTAHRAMYAVFVGPIPDGYEPDHLCRNRSCVNYNHLECVTLQENRRRRNEHKTHCVNGHLYTKKTTRIQIGRDGYECRVCRICENERHRKYYRSG